MSSHVKHTWLLLAVSLNLLLCLPTTTHADDQFLCCMKGIKRIRGIAICPAPCCYGYQEMVVHAAKLSTIVYCEKQDTEMAELKTADPMFTHSYVKRAAPLVLQTKAKVRTLNTVPQG